MDGQDATPQPLPTLLDALDGIEDGLLLIDREWRFTYVNRRAATRVGREVKDFLGRNLWEEFPTFLGTPHESTYRKVMAERVPMTFDVKGTLSDHWYRVRVSPAAQGIAVVWTDITDRKRLEQEQRETTSALRGVLNAVQESIWLFTVDGTALMGNQTALARWGKPPETVIGKNCREFLPPELVETRLARIEEAAKANRPVEFEDVRAGIRFAHTFYPVPGPDGQADRIAIFSRDVTERRKTQEALAQSEELLRLFIEHAPASLAMFDREMRYLGASRRWRFDYRCGERDLRGLSHYEVFPEIGDEWKQVHQRALAGEVVRAEADRFVRADGSVQWLRWEVRPWYEPSGAIGGIIVFSEDITGLKLAEEALLEADRHKNQFLGVLSHELRNPLAPIRNSVAILKKTGTLDAHGAKAAAIIDRQVSHLTRLIDDLLDVTRISRGKIHLQRSRLDLADVVRRTVDDMHSVLAHHRVSVALPQELVWVDGDPTRLAQIVGNLLGNAVKFTPQNGTIAVTLSRQEGQAMLEVADDGEGIEPKMLSTLFEPFVQSDRSLDRSRGGLGLGLALVKGLAQLHGGEATAHSDGPGKGARFIVRLPLGERGRINANASDEQRGTSRTGRKVLIVEDNRDTAETMREVLELDGYEVAAVYNGNDAITKALELLPEIVLCDIGLPGMDGYSVARALRDDPRTTGTFLVALTGYAGPEDQRRARNAGFDAHLAKPPDLDALERLLADAP